MLREKAEEILSKDPKYNPEDPQFQLLLDMFDKYEEIINQAREIKRELDTIKKEYNID